MKILNLSKYCLLINPKQKNKKQKNTQKNAYPWKKSYWRYTFKIPNGSHLWETLELGIIVKRIMIFINNLKTFYKEDVVMDYS